MSFDTSTTDNLICPYCGYEETDSWELGESSDNHQCGSCDKTFVYETEVSRSFTSSLAPCRNGGEHTWTQWMDFETCNWRRCRICEKSEKEARAALSDSGRKEESSASEAAGRAREGK